MLKSHEQGVRAEDPIGMDELRDRSSGSGLSPSAGLGTSLGPSCACESLVRVGTGCAHVGCTEVMTTSQDMRGTRVGVGGKRDAISLKPDFFT